MRKSANHIIKAVADWKENTMLSTIQLLQRLVRNEQINLERALFGMGDFLLAKEWNHYFRFLRDWSQWSDTKRQKRIHDFLCNHLQNKGKLAVSKDKKLTFAWKKDAGKKPHQRKRRRADKTSSKKKNV